MSEEKFLFRYKEEIFNLLFAFLTILVVVLFYKKIILTSVLVLLIAIIGLVKWKSRRTLYIFIIASIGGALAEMFCIKIGIWEYSITNFYNIPFWLFFVWGSAGVVIYQTAKLIRERKLK